MPLFTSIRAAVAGLSERFSPRVELEPEALVVAVAVPKDELAEPLSAVGEELGNGWAEPVGVSLASAADESQPLDAVVVSERPVAPRSAEHKLGWSAEERPAEDHPVERAVRRAEETEVHDVRESEPRDPVVVALREKPVESVEPVQHPYIFSRIARIFSMQLRLHASLRLCDRIAKNQKLDAWLDKQLGVSAASGATADLSWSSSHGPSTWANHRLDQPWSHAAWLRMHPGDAPELPHAKYPAAA